MNYTFYDRVLKSRTKMSQKKKNKEMIILVPTTNDIEIILSFKF